jgi:hypothetical protein
MRAEWIQRQNVELLCCFERATVDRKENSVSYSCIVEGR